MDQGTSGGATLKIDSVAQAIVASVGILAAAGLVGALAFAGWSSEAIIGFGALAVAQVVGQFVQTRKSSVIEAKNDQQSDQLATIVEQTNGRSTQELRQVAEQAAQRAVAAYRGQLPQ